MTGELIQELLQGSAARRPAAVAVIDRDREVRYGELDAGANQLGQLLVELGIGRGDRVGLLLDKSIEAVIGYYGVLKAGAIAVPLDPQSPTARIRSIAADAGMRCIVTEVAKRLALREICELTPVVERVVLVDAGDAQLEEALGRATVAGRSALAAQVGGAPTVKMREDDVAYMLYTSGSTGQPKGVALSHLNAMAFVNWAVEEFGVTSTDRLSNHAPLHFDLSVFDLFAASKVGASVALVPPELVPFPVEVAAFMERRQISTWYSVPSALTMLVRHGNLGARHLDHLRTVLFAGEVFPTKYLAQLMHLLPGRRFGNLYGPTETNVCTWYDVPPLPPSATAAIPIGRAIDGVEVVAVGEDDRVVRRGEVGELCVRGPTVMHGYWGDPDRTGKAMRPIQHTPSPWRTYRTGDLVRLGADGNYTLLGRRDAQIKRRGYRIELGEIESAIYAHPAVTECAAAAFEDEALTNRIVAYVVSREPLDDSGLNHFLTDRIPRYMIPDRIEFCSGLPKTSTGKVDRQALASL